MSMLYTTEQVRQLDTYAIHQCDLPEIVLMKRAGQQALDRLLDHWPQVHCLHICCGSGNNGGDGYVMAALAAQKKISVTVWSLGNAPSSVASQARDYALQEGVLIRAFENEAFRQSLSMSEKAGVIVDALLGTGSHGALREAYQLAVTALNNSHWPILSVDVPTGVNGDTGAVASTAVKANVTVSMIGQKIGNVIGDGRVCSGQRYVASLGVPDSLYQQLSPVANQLQLPPLLKTLPVRSLDAHKGDNGHVLVVGGDHHLGGAVIMAAQMALRVGAGLVSVATQPEHVSALLARQPEIMAAGITSGQRFLPLMSRASVMVVGPGLGRTGWSEQLLYHCLESDKPLVIDADALNLLASGQWSLPLDQRCILTPHPGEAARLLNISIEQVQLDRVAAIHQLQQRYGGTVILKGAGSLVLTTEQRLFVCDAGNLAMASGGMGDVLSGLLGSLLAQGLSTDDAACLGVLVHSMAADLWVSQQGSRGLLATDLIEPVRHLLQGNANV